MRVWRSLLFIALFIGLASVWIAPQRAQAAGTVTTCSESAIDTALTGGGTVDFNIGFDCTITFFSGKLISINTIIQNTSGFTVTFDGNINRLFTVNSGVSLTLDNLTLTNGRAAFGGAIYADGSTLLSINKVTFTNNRATAGGNGGAIYANETPTTISNSRFINNSAFSGGAGYIASTANIAHSITNSTFDTNSAGTFQAGAVALRVYGTIDPVISGNSFINNTAFFGGALGVYGRATITQNSFVSNSVSSGGGGGAMYIPGGYPRTISNNTFSGNSADQGGAIFNNIGAGGITLTHNTFVNNSATSSADSYYNLTGTINARANIFSGDSCGNLATVNDLGNNIAFGSVGCPGANTDPMLGALTGGIHTPANAAIEYAPACALAVDQVGTARPLGANCTPGAVEITVPQTITVEFASPSATFNEATPTSASVRVTTSDGLPTATSIGFSYSITGGTATSPSDYTGTPGAVSINSGVSPGVYALSAVTLIDDNRYEADETLIFQLNSPSGASFGAQTTFTFNIINDEVARVHAHPSNASVSEAIGTHNAQFMLNITGTAGALPLSTDLQIDFTVTPIEFPVSPTAALEPEDFTIPTLSGYNFPVGSLNGATVNVPVTIVDDAFIEQQEYFEVKLASVTNAILPSNGDSTYPNRQTVQINDDDIASYVVNDTTANISEPAGTTSFTIRLSSQPIGAGTVVVDFASLHPSECTPSPSQFTFDSTNWNIPQPITITAVDELLVDGTKTCTILISQNASSTAPEYVSALNQSLSVSVLDNDAPATITIIGGNPQSATVNTAFGAPLVVEVRNGSGQLVQGASVAFTPPGAGASASIVGSPATTNASGQASVTASANTIAGSYNVVVTSGSAPAVNFNLTNTTGALSSIAFVQEPSNTQAGANITPAVTVQAVDAFGNGISGQNIVLNLSSGTGTLSGTLTQATSASGIATFANLNINVVGTKQLTATLGALTDVSANFDITVSSTVGSVAFVQEPTNAVAGVNISPAVTVQVLDGFSNPMSGQTVVLTLTSGTGTLFGTISQATNASGIATFADLNINLAGTKQLTATVGAVTDVSANFDITASSTVGSVAFVQEPTNAVAGATITPAVTVLVSDAFTNPISSQNVTISLTTGTGTLSGTLTQATNASGIATFANLNINLAGTKQLTATLGALTDVSANFDITASSTVGSVAFVQEPSNTVAGANITPAVTVEVLDGFSNPISGQNVTISLTTGSGTLSGTLTQATNASGIATFANLNINLVGTKQLTATAGAQNDVSANFDIIAGTGSNLSLVSGNPQQTAISTAFASPLVVRVTDGLGNAVAGETVTFTATVGGSGQTATLSVPAMTDVNGETSVTATANGIIGAYTVDATYGATTVTFNLTNLDPNVLTVNLACVSGDLVVTIASGSANFDITSTSGGGMPLLNVPLGAYTFTGPATWQDVTVTELGGDLEVFTFTGNFACTSGTTTGTTTVAPLDPTALGCVLTADVVAPDAPDNTYCRVLMRDGSVVGYSGAVPQSLIDLGVIFAVDIYRLQGGQTVTAFPDYTQICLSGEGRLFYLDARKSPRDIIELTTETVNGLTCGWLPATGTLVLTR